MKSFLYSAALVLTAFSADAARLRSSVNLDHRTLVDATPPAVETLPEAALLAKLLQLDPSNPHYGGIVKTTLSEAPQQQQVPPQDNNGSNDRQLQAQVASLQLINANTDLPIVTLKNGMVIALDTIPNMTTPAFNINAKFNSTTVRSVKFGYNQTNRYSVDSIAPYAFCADTNGNYSSCTNLGFGTHKVTATPYTRTNAAGPAGTPITITFTIIPSDVTPPKILNFTALTPTTVDVTNGEKNVTVLITVQDDSAGFEFGLVGYGNSNEDIIEQFAYYRVVYYELGTSPNPNPIAGAPVSFIVTMTVKKYRPAGVYSLHANVGDTKFNIEYNNATDLTRKGFVGSITVVNSGAADTAPPALLSLVALKPLTINVSAADATVDFQITVQDNLSGFSYGYLSAYNESLSFDYMFDGFAKPTTRVDDAIFLDHGPELPPNVPHVFNLSLVFSKGLPPGDYGIDIEMTDGVRNWNFMNSTKLAAMGFPSKVTVVA